MAETKQQARARGKKSRTQGRDFELRTRKDLESKGWIVIKNPNTVINNKFTQGKNKYNPFTKRILAFGGFPDFIAFKEELIQGLPVEPAIYDIIGVECKTAGKLDKKEKEMCNWLLKHKIFSRILIAKKIKVKNKIGIEYGEYR
jgi:hypothetical protein